MALAVPPDELRWRPSTLIHGLEALPVRLDPADAFLPESGQAGQAK